MGSILENNDIQPPPPLIILTVTAGSRVLEGASVVCEKTCRVVLKIVTILELPCTCTVKILWH